MIHTYWVAGTVGEPYGSSTSVRCRLEESPVAVGCTVLLLAPR